MKSNEQEGAGGFDDTNATIKSNEQEGVGGGGEGEGRGQRRL